MAHQEKSPGAFDTEAAQRNAVIKHNAALGLRLLSADDNLFVRRAVIDHMVWGKSDLSPLKLVFKHCLADQVCLDIELSGVPSRVFISPWTPLPRISAPLLYRCIDQILQRPENCDSAVADLLDVTLSRQLLLDNRARENLAGSMRSELDAHGHDCLDLLEYLQSLQNWCCTPIPADAGIYVLDPEGTTERTNGAANA